VRSRAGPTAGRRKHPLESVPFTNQLSKIRCASPGAEVATNCCVDDVVMLFRSTLLHLYRYNPPSLVLTEFRVKRALLVCLRTSKRLAWRQVKSEMNGTGIMQNQLWE
jgi:hypothetical protein